MKRLFCSIIILIICFTFGACGHTFTGSYTWVKEYQRDEFNDPTEDFYLVNSKGFACSLDGEAQPSEAVLAYLSVNQSEVNISFSTNGIKDTSFSNYDLTLDIKIKLSNGEKFNITGVSPLQSSSISIAGSDADRVIAALKGKGTVGFFIDFSNQGDSILFYADCGNFVGLYEREIESRFLEKYQEAKNQVEKGNTLEAARIFCEIRNYSDSWTQCFNIWKNTPAGRETLSACDQLTIAVLEDGGAAVSGMDINVENWKNIVAVSAGSMYVVGLCADGSVVASGSNSVGQCSVSDWQSIVAVSAGYSHTVGIRADGTVVAVGSNDFGQCDVSDWKEIVAISAGQGFTVGLCRDGTVVAAGKNDYGQCDVSSWKNVIDISAGGGHTVALLKDGTAVATGLNDSGQCNVSDWKNIVAVSSGQWHSAGVLSEGTAVAVGLDYSGQCQVGAWTNIVDISAGNGYTVALTADGQALAVGKHVISDWKHVKVLQ